MRHIFLWIVFPVLVLSLLALDLFRNRKAHEIKMREALIWSGMWIGLALLFNVGVYFMEGPEKALQFLTGYLLEESLSVDNLFVFLLIFSYFRVDPAYQHRILFWGILGAIFFRAFFIVAGLALIHHFHFMLYLFGLLLIYTGAKLAFEKEKEIHPERNPFLRIFQRFFPTTKEHEGGKFFLRKNGTLFATPLFVVLLVIESTDILFAVDSVPAIIAISTDPFIVYSSNIFAILGLRSIYFALAGLMRLFHHLHYGLSAILVFIGIKMLIADFYRIPVGIALAVIASVLTLSVVASVVWPKAKG